MFDCGTNINWAIDADPRTAANPFHMGEILISLLYVSEAVPAAADPVGEIVAVSRARNAALGVTGALIFTGAHFAQVLEGSPEAVEELMTSIRRDGRHRNVETVETAEIPERRFPDWSLVYAGHSSFVDRHIRPLKGAREGKSRKLLCRKLIGLMQQFASDGRRG